MADATLLESLPRVRFTTHLPLDGTYVGLTIWVGSVARGWVGKTFRRDLFWHATWRISGQPVLRGKP